MAKRGRKPATTDYKKTLARASKELADKKKALVQAERKLAAAKKSHEGLVAEVARLDMVERSLRAMVDGTEPPTNIKYVYTYPQWVWYPSQPYIYYTYPQWQYNGSLGGTVVHTSLPGSTSTWNSVPSTITFTSCNTESLTGNSSLSALGTTCSNVSSLTASAASPSTLYYALRADQSDDGLIVDLSTFASAEASENASEPETVKTEAKDSNSNS